MRRIIVLAVLFVWRSAPLAAQEPEYFEPPPARPKFTLRWEALFRYDSISHLRVRPNIERGRFEVRPELAFAPTDRFKLAVRGVGNLGTDDNRENARNFDNYRSDGAMLDRLYVEAHPGAWTILAGQFGMPLVASEMLWDRDVQTPGAAVSHQLAVGSGTVTLTGAGFFGPQREGDDSKIFAGQAVWRGGDVDRFAVEVASAYWDFDLEDLKSHLVRQNGSEQYAGGVRPESGFRLVDVLVRLRFPALSLPATISLDGIHNLEAEGGRRNAFEGALAVGSVGTPGTWRAFYMFQYVERDAVVGAYNTDDWWFHSRYRGHRAGVAVTLLPQVYVQGTFLVQRRLDLRTWLNRITVDLVKMF
ncbi:MAG TPA: putative porin [Thermoanaerobaculia bacterium]|nr:putative porin [Thermoanaerobaculia bacterium]